MSKPIIVYVSGAPGSGKTTLAKLLSEQLYLPHVSSDLIHGGVAFTQPDHDRKQTLLNVFVPTIIDIAQRGISIVVDQVLQKGASEAHIIDKLRPHATIINIHTQTSDPIGRYSARIKNSKIPSIIERREHLLSLAAAHKEKLERTNNPLDLGVPSMTVNTDDGYSPAIGEIVDFIKTAKKT